MMGNLIQVLKRNWVHPLGYSMLEACHDGLICVGMLLLVLIDRRHKSPTPTLKASSTLSIIIRHPDLQVALTELSASLSPWQLLLLPYALIFIGL